MLQLQFLNKIILTIVIIIAPFQNLLYSIININIAGKNGFIVFTIMLIILGGLINININKYKYIHFFSLVGFFLVGFSIILLRGIIYNETNSLLDHRYIYTYIIYILCFKMIVFRTNDLTYIFRIIFISGLMTAIFFTFNKIFIPNYILGYGDQVGQILYVEESSRDLLLGSSISANMILISLFSLIKLVKYNAINKYFALIALIPCVTSISLSGSRYPILICIILTIVIIKSISETDIVLSILLCIVFFISIIYFHDIIFYRFGTENTSRIEKWSVPLSLFINSIISIIIGPSIYEENNATSINGYFFSDMSYLYVAIYFGVPYAIAYFAYLYWQFSSTNYSGKNLTFVIYIFINFALTNCIIWEQWVMMCILLSIVFIKDWEINTGQ